MLNGDTNHRGNLARAAVLGLLGSRGPLSRAETARVLGISAATVTQVTKDLLARQLITELRSVPSAGGRPATLLGLVRSAGRALGVKVTADHVAVVSVELDGTVQDSQVAPFDPRSATALDELVSIIGRAVDAHEGPLLGVGVGLPGSVDSPSSGVVDASTLGWMATPVGDLLRRRTGLPVLVDNDVNTLAVTETLYGVGRQHPSFLVVTIGRGVGCGIVLDGEVLRGGRGGAGEIGHIPVSDDGPRCECGNVGCLEAFAGEVGMVRQARELGVIADDATMASLVDTARGGDAAAVQIFEQAANLLGRTVAGLVHTIDPQVLVLTGEGVDAWELWRPGFEAAFRRHLIPSRRTIPYLVEPWSEGQWAVGAASLVLAAPFDSAGTSGRQAELVRARLQGIPARGGGGS